MSYNRREGYPRVVPVLVDEDVAAAIGWLSSAFGFREVLRWTDPTGVVRVAEMKSDNGAVMLEAPERGHAGEARSQSHGCHYVLVLGCRVMAVTRDHSTVRREPRWWTDVDG